MPLEPLLCPQCGSPLRVETSAGVVLCSYCGSQLRVDPGASEHPVGVLGETKNETTILLRQRAIDHLQDTLSALHTRRDALKEEADRMAAAATAPPPDAPAKPGPRARIVAVLAVLLVLTLLPQVVQSWIGGSAEDKTWATAMAICVVAPCVVLVLAGVIMRRRAAAEERRIQAAASWAHLRSLEVQPALAAVEEKIRSTEARSDELKADMDRLAREV